MGNYYRDVQYGNYIDFMVDNYIMKTHGKFICTGCVPESVLGGELVWMTKKWVGLNQFCGV